MSPFVESSLAQAPYPYKGAVFQISPKNRIRWLPAADNVPHSILTFRQTAPYPRRLILRHIKVVETMGIICVVGIAEIGRPIGEASGDNWRPDAPCQIGAGFDFYELIACAGDVKTKGVALDPKASVISLNQWIPQLSWSTVKRWSPANSADLVINCGLGCVIEWI